MRIFWLAVLGVVAYAAFLVGTLPASVMFAHARAERPNLFELQEARGTLWRGDARVTFNAPGGPLTVEQQWRWLPAGLATGRLAFALQVRGSGLDARYEGGRSFTRWDVRDLEARGNAAAIVALLPWLAPWRPEGNVLVTSPRLETDGRDVQGEARVEWRAAGVGLTEVKPIGSYRADVRAQGSSGTVNVTTLEGPLRVTGQGTYTPPQRIAFTGEARAEGPQAAALQPLLELLGPARPDGARAIAWQAR